MYHGEEKALDKVTFAGYCLIVAEQTLLPYASSLPNVSLATSDVYIAKVCIGSSAGTVFVVPFLGFKIVLLLGRGCVQ